METELGLNEKTSVENKLLKQIKEKLDKESKEDRTSDSRDDPVKACSSIRVASRGPRYSTDKKPSTSHSSPSSTSRHSKEKECLPVNNDSSKKTSGVKDSKVETQKSELVDSEHNDEDNGEVNVKVSDKPAIEDKVETKQKEDGSRDRDTDRKTASTKLPLIGKMPFLKRKAGISKSKSQQNTPPEEVSKGKKDTKDVSSEKLKIPLPSCTIDDDDHVNTAVEQTQPTVPKEVDDRKLPLPSVNIKEDFIPPYDPTVPPPPITGAKTWSTSDKKDSSGSALYDPLEAGDEDSSDGAAAATIEALDLLNIPLPGFKTPTEVSALPLQQETEDVYQPEDMEIENIPLDEGKIEEGIEEVYPPSGIVVHPDIPLPPAVGILPTPLSSDEPPPPGTEGTDSLLNREFDENINSGNPLPVFGPQEFIPKKATLCKIMKNKDANIPAPPGTEDEYNVEDVDHFSHLSGHSKDKAEKINRQRLHSESGSQCSSSKGAPSFSGKILQNSLMRSLAVPKMQQMDKQLQSHKERELTPPPPGTESMPDEKDQSIMGTSNTDVMKDLGLTRGDSELMLSNLKINTSQEKALLSPKSFSSSKIVNKSGSSLNLLSFKGEVNSLEDKTSEIVQNIYIKDSSNEFSTVDGKSKESDSKSSDEESSGAYLPEQPDAKNTAMSSDASSLSHTDKAALSSKDGIVGSDLLPSISCVDNSELINSKTIVSSNIDDKEDSSNQCLTMNTSDENQVSNTIDKDVSCTPLPDKHDGENETISHDSEMQVDSTVCDSQDSYKDSTFKELGEEEVNLKNTTNSVCDSQDSDEASVSKECLSSELLSLEKTVEGVYESQESDKGSAPKECLLDEMSFKEKTDSVCDGQESDKDSASKECLPDEGISFKEKTDSVCDGQESDTDFASKECLPGDKINFKEKTDSVCDGQESDKDSASRECLPDEEMCLKEPIKDNIECYVVGEGSLVHGKDDKYQIPILEDPSIIDTTSSVNTPSASNTECDSQDSEKGSFSKVCLLEEQDSDVSSSLKETPEDSNECSAIMNEKDLNLGIDINEEPKSPIIKCRSPLQFVNFPKGFESMDISDFYSPSSDSTCTQNVDASETTILKTENLPLSVSAENMIDAQVDLCGTPQRKAESTKEDTCEFYVEKDQKEPQAAEGPSCSQSIEVHGKELYTNKDSQDHDFHSYEGHDFLESKDVKDEAFPLEYPSERKVARSSRTVAEIAEYKEQETSGESEEISHDSAILIDEVDSKTSEEESASNSGSVKERKRKSVRKATRKKTTKVRKTEDDECPSPRTSASRSSAGCLSPSFVESPRPMRSSRRAAAAAIKAMAKDQDDTPPDSPPSDDDSD
ncbi:hypothetical protein E2C01_036058 [Portunus trituberculatus]|uniref:Uncharacterized protein n=1 Tax=Portunus trituberculatus TaxID=210409 RepID=A0A5B7FA66_PORTR|nr:hypothetical protein [Portunus trituberculatus]